MTLSKIIRGASKLKRNISNRTDTLKHTTIKKRGPPHKLISPRTRSMNPDRARYDDSMQSMHLQERQARRQQKRKSEYQTMFYSQSNVLPTNPNTVKRYPGLSKKLAKAKKKAEKDADRLEDDYENWRDFQPGFGF